MREQWVYTHLCISGSHMWLSKLILWLTLSRRNLIYVKLILTELFEFLKLVCVQDVHAKTFCLPKKSSHLWEGKIRSVLENHNVVTLCWEPLKNFNLFTQKVLRIQDFCKSVTNIITIVYISFSSILTQNSKTIR